jgi:hypothetical protein
MQTMEPESWSQFFTPEQHEAQIQEDRSAWRAITGILMGILAIGLFLGLSVVLIVLSSRS